MDLLTSMYDAVLFERMRRDAHALLDALADDKGNSDVAGHEVRLSEETIAKAAALRVTLTKLDRVPA